MAPKFGSTIKQVSLRSRIADFLKENGPSTINEIVAGVGKYVSAQSAKRSKETSDRVNAKRNNKGRRAFARNGDAIEVGKRHAISSELARATRDGILQRIAPLTYALPKGKP